MASTPGPGVTLPDVQRARERLAGSIETTPLVASSSLGSDNGRVLLKLENRQTTGSFKLRGALNAVLALGQEERERGVVTVSTGNHGRAVAYACRQAGVRAVVCLSRLVPTNKVAAIEAQGAEVRVLGVSQDEAQREADRLVLEEGLTLIPPFDHADVIAGQGTLGLEILEECPEVAQVIVPLSGGGLISGVALALKGIRSDVRVVGVSMERGPAMYRSLEVGRPVEVEELETLADSLGGGIGLANRYTFELVRKLVDEVVLVDEEEIRGAIVHAHRYEGQIVEGAGAVGIAALLAGKLPGHGRNTVVVLSGSNIDPQLHARLLSDTAADTGVDGATDVGADASADAPGDAARDRARESSLPPHVGKGRIREGGEP